MALRMVSSFRITAVSASFLGFPGLQQALVEAPQDRVVLACDEGCHVERGTDLGAPAPDGALAPERAAVAVEGGDADQGSDLLTIQGAELGQIGNEGAGDDIADAGHALEQVLGLAPGRRSSDGVVEVGFEVGELALERLQQPVDALDHAPIGEAPSAVALGRHHLDDLTPAGDQLAEAAGLFVRHRPGIGSDRLCEVGARRRIDGVGLGKPACGAGEIADLARVHHRKRQAGRAERARHRRLETARRFEHDQRHIQLTQASHQLIQAFSVARDGKGLPRRAHMHVEPILRHIDAYEHLFHHPSLRMRSRGADQATVRVQRNSGRGAMLTRGLRDQRWFGLPSASNAVSIILTAVR